MPPLSLYRKEVKATCALLPTSLTCRPPVQATSHRKARLKGWQGELHFRAWISSCCRLAFPAGRQFPARNLLRFHPSKCQARCLWASCKGQVPNRLPLPAAAWARCGIRPEMNGLITVSSGRTRRMGPAPFQPCQVTMCPSTETQSRQRRRWMYQSLSKHSRWMKKLVRMARPPFAIPQCRSPRALVETDLPPKPTSLPCLTIGPSLKKPSANSSRGPRRHPRQYYRVDSRARGPLLQSLHSHKHNLSHLLTLPLKRIPLVNRTPRQKINALAPLRRCLLMRLSQGEDLTFHRQPPRLQHRSQRG